MPAERQFRIARSAGVVALDGEREFTFTAEQQIGITLRENAFSSVDVVGCMQSAAREGLFRSLPPALQRRHAS
jgi:hypothetical protein